MDEEGPMLELYSVEQVADLLGLHVRTVRGYVRDGKLPATRIGKQYRIARHDLEEFTGGALPGPVQRHRRVEVTSVVQVDAVDPDTASRIGMTVVGMLNGRDSGDARIRVETAYDAERACLKIVLIGDTDDTAELLRLVGAMARGDR
ncbi:helix-turn-helix domain-containing protein [Amycolatopsis minnesotensis]